MYGLLLCDDLLFGSRITGTARALGLTVASARDTATLQDLARREAPSGIIVDLENPGLNIAELIGWLRQNCTPMPRVVAFGAHVNTAMLKDARAAGCDVVLPRSKFADELPSQLVGWLSLP